MSAIQDNRIYNYAKDRYTKRERRAKAKAKGLCPTCCARPTAPFYASCLICLVRQRDRNRLVSELVRIYREQEAG